VFLCCPAIGVLLRLYAGAVLAAGACYCRYQHTAADADTAARAAAVCCACAAARYGEPLRAVGMCKKRFGDAENRRTFTALLKAKQQGSCDIKKHLSEVLRAAALLFV